VPLFVNNRQRMIKTSWSELEARGNQLLSLLREDNSEVGVTLVSDRKMKELNREFRQKNKTTDVLSFPLGAEDLPPGFPRVLGDIIISVERALLQAEERAQEPGGTGYSLLDEMTFLLIHGVLHLLGYDHLENEEAEAMEEEERRLFLHFGATVPRTHHEENEWN